jgi:hypothetical protein
LNRSSCSDFIGAGPNQSHPAQECGSSWMLLGRSPQVSDAQRTGHADQRTRNDIKLVDDAWVAITKMVNQGKLTPAVYKRVYKGLEELPLGLKALAGRETWGRPSCRSIPTRFRRQSCEGLVQGGMHAVQDTESFNRCVNCRSPPQADLSLCRAWCEPAPRCETVGPLERDERDVRQPAVE